MPDYVFIPSIGKLNVTENSNKEYHIERSIRSISTSVYVDECREYDPDFCLQTKNPYFEYKQALHFLWTAETQNSKRAKKALSDKNIAIKFNEDLEQRSKKIFEVERTLLCTIGENSTPSFFTLSELWVTDKDLIKNNILVSSLDKKTSTLPTPSRRFAKCHAILHTIESINTYPDKYKYYEHEIIHDNLRLAKDILDKYIERDLDRDNVSIYTVCLPYLLPTGEKRKSIDIYQNLFYGILHENNAAKCGDYIQYVCIRFPDKVGYKYITFQIFDCFMYVLITNNEHVAHTYVRNIFYYKYPITYKYRKLSEISETKSISDLFNFKKLEDAYNLFCDIIYYQFIRGYFFERYDENRESSDLVPEDAISMIIYKLAVHKKIINVTFMKDRLLTQYGQPMSILF